MSFTQFLYCCGNPIYGKATCYIATKVKCLAAENIAGCVVEDEQGARARGHSLALVFELISWHEGKQKRVVMKLELGRNGPRNSPTADDLDCHQQEQVQATENFVKNHANKKQVRGSKNRCLSTGSTAHCLL